MDKRGLSPVIAVVLLVMITVVAAGIIVGFVVPFVKEGLVNSEECFNVLEDLSFAGTPYNCYYPINDSTGFSIQINDESIVGFRVALLSEGSADSYDIDNESTGTIFGMLGDGGVGGDLTVPKRGGVRTYVLYGKFEQIEIFPILESGGKCEKTDNIIIKNCVDVGHGLPLIP